VIDLVVAGGGPAGLATALHGAKAGLEVVVVERRKGPIDKACGEGLMPHTVRHLEHLGIRPPGKPFRGISYLAGDRHVEAQFRSGTGCGVLRIALHAALLDAATSAGVRFIHNDVGPVIQDSSSVRVGELRARYLAAADGLHSPIRRSLGLAQPCGGPRRWGIRRHVQIAPWTEYVEVHWGPRAEAYVTPVADECVGIAILTSRRAGFDTYLDEFPALRNRVMGCAHGPDRAAGPLRQKVRSRTAGRILLVGDAAGYVDALTGEGLGLAFGAAQLLVNCILADRLADYDRQWRHLSRRYRLLTAALLHASAYPPVRSRIVPAATMLPSVFAGLVNQLAG
jgi:flavin-dependent dehydrogenase